MITYTLKRRRRQKSQRDAGEIRRDEAGGEDRDLKREKNLADHCCL